jgi:hypothetical protein
MRARVPLPCAVLGLLALPIFACTDGSVEGGRATPDDPAGVADDDPALVAAAPRIVSSDFLGRSQDLVATARTQPSRGGRDSTPPVVAITAPVGGALVAGTVWVTVDASDDKGVTQVSLSADGSPVTSTSTSPYALPWNSATLPDGSHTLVVTARDAAGNRSTAAVQVQVNNSTAGDISSPTVSFSSPTDEASVSGTVELRADARDDRGVVSVTYRVDGTVIGTVATAPYVVSWSAASVASGIHTLTATAADAAGNVGSTSIQVTVNTTVLPPTSLPSSVSLTMPAVGDQGAEFSCVAFAVGYAARSAEAYYTGGASSYGLASNVFSPEFLYNHTVGSASCGSGSGIVTALEYLKSTGITTWQTMPYSDLNGCAPGATSAMLAEAATHRIATYAALYKADVTGIKTMLAANHPLIMTINLDASFTNAEPGFVWRAYEGAGGFSHAVVISGYDDARRAFKVMNSWGTDWGDAGYSWIDYEFLAATGGQWVFVIDP